MSLTKIILLASYSLFFVCGLLTGRDNTQDWIASFVLYSMTHYYILPFCTGKPMSLPYSSEIASVGEKDGYRYLLFGISFVLALTVLAN
ncbi:hypothetical protein [Pseudoalteromonas sp. MelDa3]|jgi:hypothetical protein|uniref:hypothetical protein n=1 Tax=Pseudoalteromonas sp. MelDa3 TaxID=888435 RepID=UPI000CC00FF1|nr:hypothetical protein [Pseudoalteromonas sp. MelDa3]PLT24230.1 hypothetical protein CXF89_16700 [Pseudoalteromonas sp. MelDa3]